MVLHMVEQFPEFFGRRADIRISHFFQKSKLCKLEYEIQFFFSAFLMLLRKPGRYPFEEPITPKAKKKALNYNQ